jgi:hypothetical protein
MDDFVFVTERKHVFFGVESVFFMKLIIRLKIMLRSKLNKKYFAPLKRFLNQSFVAEKGIQIPLCM